MKKIILFIVLFLSFTMNVNASEWQELKENISTEGIELEFRYRFYKEEIRGDYFRVDVDSSHLYQYEDPEIK